VGGTAADLSGLDLGIIVDGATSGNGFEYEIYLHKEFITVKGLPALQGETASHSDMVGLSAIRNTVETNLPMEQPKEVLKKTSQAIAKYTPEDTSGFTASGLIEGAAPFLDVAGPIMSLLL
jgi:hypothetical protein